MGLTIISDLTCNTAIRACATYVFTGSLWMLETSTEGRDGLNFVSQGAYGLPRQYQKYVGCAALLLLLFGGILWSSACPLQTHVTNADCCACHCAQ